MKIVRSRMQRKSSQVICTLRVTGVFQSKPRNGETMIFLSFFLFFIIPTRSMSLLIFFFEELENGKLVSVDTSNFFGPEKIVNRLWLANSSDDDSLLARGSRIRTHLFTATARLVRSRSKFPCKQKEWKQQKKKFCFTYWFENWTVFRNLKKKVSVLRLTRELPSRTWDGSSGCVVPSSWCHASMLGPRARAPVHDRRVDHGACSASSVAAWNRRLSLKRCHAVGNYFK